MFEVSHSLVQVINVLLTSVGLNVPEWLHTQGPKVTLLLYYY